VLESMSYVNLKYVKIPRYIPQKLLLFIPFN